MHSHQGLPCVHMQTAAASQAGGQPCAAVRLLPAGRYRCSALTAQSQVSGCSRRPPAGPPHLHFEPLRLCRRRLRAVNVPLLTQSLPARKGEREGWAGGADEQSMRGRQLLPHGAQPAASSAGRRGWPDWLRCACPRSSAHAPPAAQPNRSARRAGTPLCPNSAHTCCAAPPRLTAARATSSEICCPMLSSRCWSSISITGTSAPRSRSCAWVGCRA